MLLLSAGWNDDGQLGRYVTFEEEEIENPAGAVDVKSNEIKNIAVGKSHSIVLYNDGTVIGWGSNHLGQIGFPERISYPNPTEITFFNEPEKSVVNIACASNTTVYLTILGFVFIANKYNPKNQPIIKLDIRETIVKMSNCYEFPWVVGESGKFYEITKKNKIIMHQIEGQKIKDCSSGDNFCIAIDKDGFPYGNGDIIFDKCAKFQPIVSLVNECIKSVYANKNHCFALTEKGQVYVWGKGEYGHLGLGEKIINITSDFQLIPSLQDVIQISTSSITTCFITSDHKLYSCGYFGSYLISNSTEKVYLPKNVTRKVYGPAHLVSCGDHHTLVLSEGALSFKNRLLDPSSMRLQDELERYKKRHDEQEMLKRKAEEEIDILKGRLEEGEEMIRKTEEEAKLALQRREEEEAKRRKEQKEEEIRKEEIEAAKQKEMAKNEAEIEAKRQIEISNITERSEKMLEDEIKLRKKIEEKVAELQRRLKEEQELRKQKEGEVEGLKEKNSAAFYKIEQLTKEIEDLKALASKSKCCNIC